MTRAKESPILACSVERSVLRATATTAAVTTSDTTCRHRGVCLRVECIEKRVQVCSSFFSSFVFKVADSDIHVVDVLRMRWGAQAMGCAGEGVRRRWGAQAQDGPLCMRVLLDCFSSAFISGTLPAPRATHGGNRQDDTPHHLSGFSGTVGAAARRRRGREGARARRRQPWP